MTSILASLLLLSAQGCDQDNAGAPGPDGGLPGDAALDGSAAEAHLETLIDAREVQLTDGLSEVVTFDVPADAISVTIAVSGLQEETYAITGWRQPNGNMLVEEGWTDGSSGACFSCENRVLIYQGAIAAVAPNNPSVTLVPGEHSVRIRGFLNDFTVVESSAVVHLDVVAKISDGTPATGVLDLNLHFTGGGGLTAESAQTDVAFQEAMEEVRSSYAAIGIALGELRYLDIDSQYAHLTDWEGTDLVEMLAIEHAMAMPQAANIFFVAELAGGGLGQAIIPGPVRPGTHRSGVTIGVETAVDELGETISHELGHFLGLWHTHDPVGSDVVSDQLDDTTDYGGNVMNSELQTFEFTEQQGQVLRRSTFVR